MFERFTENARRTLFFSRYEATQYGSLQIESLHLLLGLLREATHLERQVVERDVPFDDLRVEIEHRLRRREPVSPSVEIPFAAETKQILQNAAAEADRLGHRDIGPEHLLLGILVEKESQAAELLVANGLSLGGIRDDVARQHEAVTPPSVRTAIGDNLRTTPQKISIDNAQHYAWGNGCEAWHLVNRPSLSVIRERMPPGTSEVRHSHNDSRQFFFVLSGTVVLEVDGTDHTLSHGEGLEVSPGLPHQLFNRSADALEFLLVSQPHSHGDRDPGKVDKPPVPETP